MIEQPVQFLQLYYDGVDDLRGGPRPEIRKYKTLYIRSSLYLTSSLCPMCKSRGNIRDYLRSFRKRKLKVEIQSEDENE